MSSERNTVGPLAGRIMKRVERHGTVKPERVDQRAREIAMRRGRGPEDVEEMDRVRAWHELVQEQGSGPVNLGDLLRRSEELAMIDGRRRDEVTEEDRIRAWNELHGRGGASPSDSPQAHHAISRNPGEPPVRTMHAGPVRKARDESELEAAEVREGVREAAHERMVDAQREEAEENRK